jgi:hypothetical protein
MIAKSSYDAHGSKTFFLVVGMIAYLGVTTFTSPLYADDLSRPRLTEDSYLTEENATAMLRHLRLQHDRSTEILNELREEVGSDTPRIAEAEKRLEQQRELLSLYNELIPRLVGPRDEQKSAQIKLLLERIDEFAGSEKAARQNEAVPPSDHERTQAAVMKLEELKRQLAAREAALSEAARELAKLERGRSLPPLLGELKVFSLRSVPAKSAADAIESLFGVQDMRVAVDERTNTLIVFGKAEAVPKVEALLLRLDENDQHRGGATGEPQSRRSLLLRLFWLADGLPEGEGSDPAEILPASVLRATQKLGLRKPRLVAQTVNSLAVGGADDVNFATSVPAVLAKQTVNLDCSGEIKLVRDDMAGLEMKIQVTMDVSCQVQGSLAIPLEHFMVLGTANSVMADAFGAPGAEGAMMGAEGGMAGGFGGRFQPFGRAQIPVAVDDSGQPVEPKFTTSRFAFVVQVIDGESFPPED